MVLNGLDITNNDFSIVVRLKTHDPNGAKE
jgi:hypothetical protein